MRLIPRTELKAVACSLPEDHDTPSMRFLKKKMIDFKDMIDETANVPPDERRIILQPYKSGEIPGICRMWGVFIHSYCSIAAHECGRGEFDLHEHPQIEAFTVLEGSMDLYVTGKDGKETCHRLMPKSFITLPPDTPHRAKVEVRCYFLAQTIPKNENWPGVKPWTTN